MKKILAILGPTATGKTDVALYLAKKFYGELIACDSRQVYTGLDIGSGKMPSIKGTSNKTQVTRHERYWEIDGIKIWMYDVADPKTQRYTVANYVPEAQAVVNKIQEQGKLPIIVGGTGLYLKGLLGEIPNLEIPINYQLREELSKLDLKSLQDKLKEISPQKWEQLTKSDKQNPRRLLRSIEIVSMNPYIDIGNKSLVTSRKFNVLKIGLTAPREELYKKVDLRVLNRLDQGMIEEARRLYQEGLNLEQMSSFGLEYGILADYLAGKIQNVTGDRGLIKIMQYKIHGYVRRQQTWFKKEKDIKWFDITHQTYLDQIEKMVGKWYDKKNV